MSDLLPLRYTFAQLPDRSGCRRISQQLLLTALTSFISGYIVLPAVFSLLLKPGSALAGLGAACGPLLSVTMLLIITRYHSGSFRKTMLILGFRRFPVKTLLYGIFIAAAIMITAGGITLIWGTIAELLNWDLGVPPTVEAAMSENIWDVAALLVTALAAAPFFEEVFFRRVMFGSLQQLLPAFPAAMLASLAFSAMHLSLLQLPGLLLIGWIWQRLYMGSQTLWTSLILHFYNNLIAAVLLMMMRYMDFQAV